MHLRAATICQAGTLQGSLEDCFLNGSYMPDSFAQKNAEHKHLDHNMATSAKQTTCFAVFDSQGGTNYGDTATRLAAEDLKKEINRIALLPLPDIAALMDRYAGLTRDHFRQVAALGKSLTGMGTGLVCLCVHDRQAVVIHFGHGRAYICHHGVLRELNAVQPVEDITARMEIPEPACITTGLIPIEDQDRILICSESLASFVSEEKILSCLENADPHQAAALLIGAALSNDGRENITATVVAFSEVAHQPAKTNNTVPAIKFDRTSTPQPHIEHHKRVLKIPEKKIKVGKTTFGHVFFWEVIPAWLQFWSLIVLLLLLIFLIWMFGPRLFS